jgi:hypothetical protein
MNEINPLNGPVLFVCFPDPEVSAYVQAVVQGSGQGHQVLISPTLSDLYEALSSIPDSATLITDLMWDGQDASDVLLSMALNYPQVGILALTNYQITEILPPFFPIPCVQGIDQIDQWLSIVFSLTEDLRGTEISGYQLKNFLGQNQLARVYSAHQPTIRRDVQLVVLPAHSTEESKESFRRIASARAGNIHPVIYAIYEEGEEGSRAYVAEEQIISPSLLQLNLQGATFDSRLLAKIINIAATAIKHHQTRGIPYQPLRSSHITLSSDGVIKFINTALPPDQALPDTTEQLFYLNQIVREFITPTEALHPALGELLTDMESGTASVDDVVTRSDAIDIELAPVKFTPQRQETVIAQQQVQKARKSFWLAAIGGIVAFALFSIWFVSYILSSYVLVPPGKDFRQQAAIPAGDVLIGTKTYPVPAFYLDEHEVTIGQYEKFLKATEGQDPASLLPAGLKMNKKNFIPLQWDQILKAINKKKDFEGGPLTKDSPIMNVDFIDASAYAAWAGKRLPTELEWIRAAAGDANLTYPWGNEADPSKANTGRDKNPTSNQAKAGFADGYRGLNPVDALSSDSSPYGILNMAGNVSEWVTTSPELGPMSANRQPFHGGNHGIDKLIPSKLRTGESPNTRNPYLGLRCASDGPVD